MKKVVLVGLLSGLLGLTSQAQVKDISVTIAPTAEYSWWDSETILEDATLVGGRVGFGFGRYFEVRGVYLQSFDLKGTLDKWDFTEDLAKDIKDTKVDVTRIGGEIKANIALSSKLQPYITLGTGVQKFEFKRENQNKDKYKEKQIYASAGLGVKLNLSDRMVLSLEGRNTVFNMDENNQYLRPDIEKDGKSNRLYNWSALAGLEFYLGGRNPKEMTELDRAYRNSFRGGMSAAKFSIEPGMMYINFDDDSAYSDSYFIGAGIGFDFTEYIGVRGFYYQATEDRKFKFKPDNSLQIYGGNIIARLNNNLTGVAPYLSLGGGYINPDDDYKNDEGEEVKDGSVFAMGGLGIEIPLTKNILAYGSANYLMTADNGVDAQNVATPTELRHNVAYRAGVRFQLGSRTKSPKTILADRRRVHQNEMDELRAEYEKRIEALNEKLEMAYAEDNVDEAVVILEERKRCEKQLDTIEGNIEESVEADVEENVNENIEEKTVVVKTAEKTEMVRMSREEFENLVNEVVRRVDGTSDYEFERINQLENALLRVNANTPEGTTKVQVDDANAKILEELRKLNKRVEYNTDMITKSLKKNEPVAAEPQKIVSQTTTVRTVENGEVVEETTNKTVKSKMRSEGLGAFIGLNFGEEFAGNLGLRAYYPVSKSNKIKFMPELYIGVGQEGTAFGLSGNMLYQFNGVKKGKLMNPYVGLGLGLFNHDGTNFGPNIIVGTELDVLDGKVFIDYSSRNLFKNNQVAVGYRFTF